jgi:hypothetical protein
LQWRLGGNEDSKEWKVAPEGRYCLHSGLILVASNNVAGAQ